MAGTTVKFRAHDGVHGLAGTASQGVRA